MGEGHTIKLAQQEAARGALESLDELINIAAAQEPSGAVDYSYDADKALQGDVLTSESLKNESPASAEVYRDEEGKNAGLSSASVTKGDAGQSVEPVDGSRGSQIGSDASSALSAEPDSEREALSVTNDV
jgi:hypothetical protein